MDPTAQIRLRPSQGPVAKHCASSMYAPPGSIEVSDPPTVFSSTGSALHKVFEDLIYPGKDITKELLIPYIRDFQVTMDGYFGIHWRANQIREKWAKVSSWYLNAKSEQRIECTLKNGFVLGGKPDLWNVFEDYAVVFDLKTGEGEDDYFPQVELYALILWKLYGALGLERVHVALFCPMLERYESRVFTAEYLANLEDAYVQAMSAAGIQYAPGPWCKRCRRLTGCPVIVKAVDPLCEDIHMSREVLPGDLARMRPAVAVMEKIIERFKLVEKGLVERFGTIDMGNGYELYQKTLMINSYRPKETLEYLLREGIPMDSIVGRLTFSKEDLKELARFHPQMKPRDKDNGLGATQARILNALQEQGATEEKPRKQIAQRPIPDTQIPQEV